MAFKLGDLIIDRNHTIYILSFRGRELTIRGWSIDDGVNIAAKQFTITNQVSTHGSDCLYNKSNQDYPFNDLDSIFNLFSYKYLETLKKKVNQLFLFPINSMKYLMLVMKSLSLEKGNILIL